MRSEPTIERSLCARVGLALLVSAALFASGCSKNSSSPAVSTGGGTDPTFDLPFSTTGTVHEIVFSQIGSWNYHCNFHSSMTGTVVVNSTAPTDSAFVSVGGSSGFQFTPQLVTIHQGGKVHWESNVNISHTVTRP